MVVLRKCLVVREGGTVLEIEAATDGGALVGAVEGMVGAWIKGAGLCPGLDLNGSFSVIHICFFAQWEHA